MLLYLGSYVTLLNHSIFNSFNLSDYGIKLELSAIAILLRHGAQSHQLKLYVPKVGPLKYVSIYWMLTNLFLRTFL